ncbi:phytanoyl-CoA dioxygenase family protein [Paenibacillus thermotolerans]|uniref:phytanoyl-CoA dioxygenase family protein n=1 Tax=Paenibacillus thermotolerans TaxID=3027807 RepID=UPI002368A6D0|nr:MULTISPECIES: phytanoyl-CoA dioxygenase family protein [unclassified Paenibacillus]
MSVTHEQKVQMLENGYVHLSGIIEKERLDLAMRHINHSIGEAVDAAVSPSKPEKLKYQEIANAPAITDLVEKTPVYSAVECMLGTGNVNPVGGAQIALRYPILNNPEPLPVPHPHLDGMHTPTNGVKKGTIGNFTALVGIFLSDVPDDYCGNFTVWPGTHRINEQYFKKHGPESLLNGMPDVEMPKPNQITAKAGDVVICHYLLAHGVALNLSPNIRYALFFRIFHKDLGNWTHRTNWQAPMTDMWLHWPGIREMIKTD